MYMYIQSIIVAAIVYYVHVYRVITDIDQIHYYAYDVAQIEWVEII